MSKEVKKTAVPRLRFPEFVNAKVWIENKIGDHLTESLIKGSSGDLAKKITVKLWGKGVFEKNEVLKGSSNTQYYVRKAGQFIFSKLDFLNQAFGIVPSQLDKFESTVDLPCFDVGECVDVRFLLEYVMRKGFYTRFGETADGSRKARRIHAEVFLSFPIYLPDIGEQKKITNCLSSLDNLITTQKEKIAALKNYKKGLVQYLFPQESESVPRLRFSEFQNDGEWEEKKIGDISPVITAGGTPSTIEPKYWGGNIRWMNSGELNLKKVNEVQGRITKLGLDNSSTKIIPPMCVLVGLAGQGKTRGTVALNDIELCTNQSIAAIYPDEAVFSSEFLYHGLDNRYDELRRLSAGGGGRGGLNLQIIRNLKLHLPKNKKEQTKIADCLSSLDDLIVSQTDKVEFLRIHKKGLLQQLFPSINESSR